MNTETGTSNSRHSAHLNWLFWSTCVAFGVFYIALIVALILSDFQYASWQDITNSLADENVRYSIWLSLITCTISAIVSMWFAIPIGYVLARLGRDAIERKFARRPIMRRLAMLVRYLVDTLLDIPIVLPPLVVGISLLILFQTSLGRWLDDSVQSMFSILGYRVGGITYEIPAIVLSQFTVAAAFAIRTMRGTFEQISEEPELVALTLGASRSQGFCRVAMPQAWRGSVAAFTLAWARSLGEFGPILIFAGTARMKTEVLSTTVYLSFQSGNLRGAVAASLILVTLAIVALVFTRLLTLGNGSGNGPAGGVVA